MPLEQDCVPCSFGTYCPNSGAVTDANSPCPDGKLCNNITNRIDADLEYCPEGVICDKTVTDFKINNDINTPAKPKACPNGFWCGQGTKTDIYSEGDFTTPQPCGDGVICG